MKLVATRKGLMWVRVNDVGRAEFVARHPKPLHHKPQHRRHWW